MIVLFGNQLFDPAHLEHFPASPVFMCEDAAFCRRYRYHQHKLVLMLAAMRGHAAALKRAGFEVTYVKLEDTANSGLFEHLAAAMNETGDRVVHGFEVEHARLAQRLRRFCSRHDFDLDLAPTPMFLASRSELDELLPPGKRPHMASFYSTMRRQLDILVDADGSPQGGRWSFDDENRKALPKSVEPPAPSAPAASNIVTSVIELVADEFPDHPGDAATFALPTTRTAARAWLDEFLERRFEEFGPYEDAVSQRSRVLFHSLLSPLLNLGLLEPREVIDAALAAAATRAIPLNSLEGFVRQVTGWREFIRLVYWRDGEAQAESNYWNHDRGLGAAWYDGTTGIPILDDAIVQANETGWNHHIQRLMVVANLMNLCEASPAAAYRWFMEMFVDAYEWVMVPNVFGMGLYSDGGVFATKPYLCGSNYLRKMSDYPKGEWCDIVDGLYWRFVQRHEETLAANPRTAMMTRNLKRMSADRFDRINDAAEAFLDRVMT